MRKDFGDNEQLNDEISNMVQRAEAFRRVAAQTDEQIRRLKENADLNRQTANRDLSEAFSLRLQALRLGVCHEVMTHILQSRGKLEFTDEDLGLIPEQRMLLVYNTASSVDLEDGRVNPRYEHLRRVCSRHSENWIRVAKGADDWLNICTIPSELDGRLLVRVGLHVKDVTNMPIILPSIPEEVYNYLDIPCPTKFGG